MFLGKALHPTCLGGECPCTYCKSLWIKASAKLLNVNVKKDAHIIHTNTQFRCTVDHTCVVLSLQMQVMQLVDVTDVHLLFIQLCLVEVLERGGEMERGKERERDG